MIQISKRQIKIRQKFTKSSWSLWRACGFTSIVEALLRAERAMYWTFSMATRKQRAQIKGFKRAGKKKSCQEQCKVPIIFSFCFRQPLWSWESRKVKSQKYRSVLISTNRDCFEVLKSLKLTGCLYNFIFSSLRLCCIVLLLLKAMEHLLFYSAGEL